MTEERILIEGQKIFPKKRIKLFSLAWTVLALIVAVSTKIKNIFYAIKIGKFQQNFGFFDEIKRIEEQTRSNVSLARFFIITSVIIWLVYYILTKYELTLTNKRVYGKVLFKKRVDLPLDSISSIGTSSLGGIYFGTSSGKIHFKFMKNKNQIHSAINNILIERQNSEKATYEENVASSISNADEIKKFKDLLDLGIITQEEFDAKKKQLLDL